MARAHINQESTTNDKSRLSRWAIIHLPDGWNRVRATERTATMEDGRAAGQPVIMYSVGVMHFAEIAYREQRGLSDDGAFTFIYLRSSCYPLLVMHL
jgi:hypothetical protein